MSERYSSHTARVYEGFKFDLEKSAANLAKHGIDFERAKAMWANDDAVEIDAQRHRAARRVTIEGRHWIAFDETQDTIGDSYE